MANRPYNSLRVSQDLAPFLNEVRPSGSFLHCYDGEACLNDGLCQIDHDTKSNSQRTRGCQKQQFSSSPKVSVYDSGTYASFDIECNRTACNSLDTVVKGKEILAGYNLTDANGRINDGSSVAASLMMIATVLLSSKLFN